MNFIYGAALGVISVEVLGYIWHRFVEHDGFLGDGLRYRHWVHHEVLYPPKRLRPSGRYHDAGSWTWYLAGGVCSVLALILLPLDLSVPFVVAAWLYGLFLEVLHRSFHIFHSWFKRWGWWSHLRSLHDRHHQGHYNFGVLLFGMDLLFGTKLSKGKVKDKSRFPGYKK